MGKKILFIVWNLSRGGAQNVVYSIINGLPENVVPTLLYLNQDDLSMREDFDSLGVELTYFENKKMSRRFNEFRKVIKSVNPDLVHSHLGPGFLSLYLFLRILGIRKVYNTFHLGLYPEEKKEWIVQLFIKKYFTVTKESAVKHSKFYNVLPVKHEVVYNGIDVEGIQLKIETSSDLHWDKGIHILSIANLHPLKGYKMALPIIEHLMSKYHNLHYHICGGAVYTDETQQWINDFVTKSHFHNRIHLHGQVDNVFPYCKNADIFLSTSEKELLPISLLEAMASGLPVVFSDVGGVSEVLGNNEFGLLVDPFNEASITRVLEDVIRDEKLRKKLSEKSLERVSEFDITKTYSIYYDYYK